MEDNKNKAAVDDSALKTFDDLAQLKALSELNPDLANDEEFKNLSNIITKVASTGNAKPDASEDDEEEYDEEEEEENSGLDNDEEEEEDEEETDEDDEEEEEDEDDPFGSRKSKKTVDVPFSLDEKAKAFLKKKYAIADEGKFFASVDKWRTDSQKLNEVQDNNEELLEGLQSLPDNIKAAINAFAEGQDYHEAFGNVNRFNFNKEFKDQDKDDVVSHYFPDKYKVLMKKLEDEDLTEDEVEERINDLADAAEALYKKDKKGIEEKRADLIRKEQDRVKKMKESVNSSVKHLQKIYPNFRQAELQRIRQILVEGNPDSIFFNKDGSYKEDAAVRLANALHYSKLVKEVKNKAKNEGVSEANLEIVNKGKKKMDKSKAAAGGERKEAALKAVEHLTTQFRSDPYE